MTGFEAETMAEGVTPSGRTVAVTHDPDGAIYGWRVVIDDELAQHVAAPMGLSGGAFVLQTDRGRVEIPAAGVSTSAPGVRLDGELVTPAPVHEPENDADEEAFWRRVDERAAAAGVGPPGRRRKLIARVAWGMLVASGDPSPQQTWAGMPRDGRISLYARAAGALGAVEGDLIGRGYANAIAPDDPPGEA